MSRGDAPVIEVAAHLLVPFLLLVMGCNNRDSVPTCAVQRRTFEHRVTAEGTLKAAEITVISVPPEVQRSVRIAWIAPDGVAVRPGDLVARFDPTDMEEQLRSGQGDLESATLEVGKMEAASDTARGSLETDLQVAELEVNLAQRFQKTDDAIFSRHEIIESEIDGRLATERKQHATDSRAIQERLARTNLELLNIKRRRAQMKIDQARDGLQALEVRAPHAGLLTLARGWRGEPPQIGSEVWKGQQIAEIPDPTTMQAEVYVLEADAGGLAPGKPATVVIEAHPERQYSAVIGRVDTVAKPRLRSSPVQYFGVTLELETTDPEVMKPGHRVRATLLLVNLEDALVVPRQAVHERNGERVVFVRNGRRFKPCPVQVKAASLGLLAIDGAVSPGDLVALREPADLEPGAASRGGTAGAQRAQDRTR